MACCSASGPICGGAVVVGAGLLVTGPVLLVTRPALLVAGAAFLVAGAGLFVSGALPWLLVRPLVAAVPRDTLPSVMICSMLLYRERDP